MSDIANIVVPRAGLEPANIGGMSGKRPDPGEIVPWPLPLDFPPIRGAGTQQSTRAVLLRATPLEHLSEVAWDREGVWAGDGPEPAGGPLPLALPCQCGRCELAVFLCFWCRRAVPWCFGSSMGDGPEEAIDGLLCDDCWCERHGVAVGAQAVAQ